MRAAHVGEGIGAVGDAVAGEGVQRAELEQAVGEAGVVVEAAEVEVALQLSEPAFLKGGALVEAELRDVVERVVRSLATELGSQHGRAREGLLEALREPGVERGAFLGAELGLGAGAVVGIRTASGKGECGCEKERPGEHGPDYHTGRRSQVMAAVDGPVRRCESVVCDARFPCCG